MTKALALSVFFAVVSVVYLSALYAFEKGVKTGHAEASIVASEAQDAMCTDCFYKGFNKARKEYGDDSGDQADRY